MSKRREKNTFQQTMFHVIICKHNVNTVQHEPITAGQDTTLCNVHMYVHPTDRQKQTGSW